MDASDPPPTGSPSIFCAAHREAFERDVLVHLDAAYRYARHLCAAPQDADDVVQTAILRAYRHFDGARPASTLPWLLAIVRNCFLTAYQQRMRVSLTGLPEDEAPEALADPAGGPEAEAIAAGDAAALRHVIAALSVEQREVLVLREVEDLAYQDIASVLGVKIGTVMSRLARARAALRTHWIAAFGDAHP